MFKPSTSENEHVCSKKRRLGTLSQLWVICTSSRIDSNQGKWLQNVVWNACHGTGCCLSTHLGKKYPRPSDKLQPALRKLWYLKQQTPQPTAAPSTAAMPTQKWAKRTHGACGLTSSAVENIPGLNYESSWSVAVMCRVLCIAGWCSKTNFHLSCSWFGTIKSGQNKKHLETPILRTLAWHCAMELAQEIYIL